MEILLTALKNNGSCCESALHILGSARNHRIVRNATVSEHLFSAALNHGIVGHSACTQSIGAYLLHAARFYCGVGGSAAVNILYRISFDNRIFGGRASVN
ncbi:hypothetical protein CSC04_1408 [Enterobacter roggenkampii]|nr:hypothetical protein CSC04_1408 [Enterobacter roggenkampii]